MKLIFSIIIYLILNTSYSQELNGSWYVDQVEFNYINSSLDSDIQERLLKKYHDKFNAPDFFSHYIFNDSVFKIIEQADTTTGNWELLNGGKLLVLKENQHSNYTQEFELIHCNVKSLILKGKREDLVYEIILLKEEKQN